MATHKSAEKRARQATKRRLRNREVKSRVKTVVKACRTATDAETLRAAESALRRAASKGILPKRQVSRRVSRLARRLR